MENQCEKIRENIQGYFDNSLSKQAYENIEKHLQECVDCAWYFREYERMNEILSRWKAPAAGENFEEKVTAEITEKTLKKSKSFLFSFFKPAFAGLTVLALIILMAAVYYFSIPKAAGVGHETGDRLVSEEGFNFDLKTGKKIYSGDSGLELLLNDGSYIKLMKGSGLTIDTFRDKKICSLLGDIKADIRKYPGQEFIIETDNAEIEVYGTRFIASAMKLKTIVSVIEGNVIVKGNKEKTLLAKGNMTVVLGSSSFLTQISFLDAARDRDKYVRIQAIRALIEIRGKEEIQCVAGLLSDAEPEVRAEAAIALSLSGTEKKEAIKPLLKALHDKDKFVRMYAALALGKLKVTEAGELLKRMEEEDEPEARLGGALGLSGLGEQAEAPDFLIKELDSGEAGTRCTAVKILGKIGNQKAALKLAEKLKDPEKKVRWYALRALERLKVPGTFPAIAAAMQDPDDDIKIKALQTVSNVFYAEAAGETALLLSKTSSREVKFSAIRALGYLLMNYYKNDKPALLEILEKYINGGDRLPAVTALTAYARAAGTGSEEKIREAGVKSGNEIIKETSAELLKIINKPDFRFNLRSVEIRALGKSKEKTVVPVLTAAAGDWNPLTREAAMEGFENLNDKLYLPLLYEGMKDIDPRAAEAAEEAVKAIMEK